MQEKTKECDLCISQSRLTVVTNKPESLYGRTPRKAVFLVYTTVWYGLVGECSAPAGIQGPRRLLSVALPLSGDFESSIRASESSQQSKEERMEDCAESFYVPG